jgi:dGTPase
MPIENKVIWEKASSLRGCLSSLKTTSSRRRDESDEDPLRVENPFVSDEAKLLSSKTFRVMADKTQVFTFPQHPLIRSRQSHVMEVVAVSVIASEILGLNTNLVRAAAVGHDIGHVPFGHQGEMWMAKAMGQPRFCHEVMGPIIAQKIERKGKGLNLTWNTLEAMMCHSGTMARPGMSQEAWTLRYTDKFTYVFHDFNDAVVRMRYPVSHELLNLANAFGGTQRERTTTAIAGLVVESAECGFVSFERSELGIAFKRLRDLMNEMYPHVTQQNVGYTMEPTIEFLRMLNIGDPFLLLALMTDRDVANIAAAPMKDMQLFNRTAVSEIAPYLREIGTIDLCDPGLNW